MPLKALAPFPEGRGGRRPGLAHVLGVHLDAFPGRGLIGETVAHPSSTQVVELDVVIVSIARR
jgi:hypothetical protein